MQVGLSRAWRAVFSALFLLSAVLAPAAAGAGDTALAATAASAAAAIGVTTGDGAWAWQHPTPQGNDLHAVRFADGSTAWAVGKAGAVLRSGDGGATWEVQYNGSAVPQGQAGAIEALFGLAVWDALTAVAVGPGGTALFTVDGGASWHRGAGAASSRAGGGPAFLISVAYAGPSTLHAVGLDGAYLRSDDGGATWHEPSAPAGGTHLRQVQFLNAADGFILADGPVILATRDGGASWQRVELPAGRDVRAFSFASLSTGIVVGGGGLILKTSDAGATWWPIASGTAADLFGVSFSADPATGSTSAHATGDGVLLRSGDAGETWAVAASLPGTRLIAASVVEGQAGVAAGFGGTLLRTGDGGVTWTPVYGAAAPASSGLRGVHFVSDEVAVAVGERGTVLKSADRGNTWRAVRSGTQRDLYAVTFLNRLTGFAVGDAGTILRSDDTGETWSPVASPIALNLRAIAFAPGASSETGVGLIVGDTGLILRTDNGGRTWSRVNAGQAGQDQLFSVHFPDARVAYVGGLRTISQSADAGRSWRLVSNTAAGPPAPNRVRDPLAFSFPSVNRGYAVGVEGQIFRSTDGGTTWVQQNSRTTRRLRSVHFLDEATGYAAGDDGVVLATSNGGETWTPVASGTHQHLWGVRFLDRGIGLLIGDAGAILKTTSGGLPTRAAPPTITSSSPAANQAEVPLDQRIRLTFNKPVRVDTDAILQNGALQLRDQSPSTGSRTGIPVPISAAYDAGQRQLVIAPLEPLVSGYSYVVHLRRSFTAEGAPLLTDLEGRPLATDWMSAFSTACPADATGGFGRLLAQDPGVRERAGCAEGPEVPIPAAEQVFERGHMLWRGDSRQIFVTFYDTGRWEVFEDTWTEADPPAAGAAPAGLTVPSRGFGKIWRENPSVRERLGWALRQERSFDGAAQQFRNALMTWTGAPTADGAEGGQIRVYFADEQRSTLTVRDPNR